MLAHNLLQSCGCSRRQPQLADRCVAHRATRRIDELLVAA